MKEKSIIKREDGRYEIRYHYGYKENGQANYKSIYGRSRSEAIYKYKKKLKT